MAKLSKEKYLVLMVDDSEDDCLLIKMVLGDVDRLHFIGSVSDGEEVLAYLQGSGQLANRLKFPIPDLLLLDLVMPRKKGFEVLEWLQSQPFDNLIVVVLSGSNRPENIRRAMELGADVCPPKEASIRKREEFAKLLEQYLRGIGN